MMKTHFLKTLTIMAIVLSYSHLCQAQNAFVSSGGDASDGAASINYTVGQTIQETIISSEGSLIQGIQFYFPSSVLKIIDLENNLDVSTFPNPTSSAINVKIDGVVGNELKYELYTLSGQMVLSDKISGNVSEIDVNHLPSATYLLKVRNLENNSMKSFKIIKN